MAPKKAPQGVKREKILLEVKKEIIRKHKEGMRVINLAKEYGRSPSTIGTILQNKEKIIGRDQAKGVTRITKKRPPVMEEVEKLLMLWIQEKQRAGGILTEKVICAKAKALHADLLEQNPGTSAETEVFKASHGWFAKFKARSGIHSVVRRGEAASSDVPVAEDFATEFLELVVAEDYLPRQVFNCDETGLFWKRMPKRTFIAEEEAALPSQKPEKMTEDDISTAEIKEALEMWEKFEAFVRKKHPNKPVANRHLDAMNTTILPAFRGILKRRQKQQRLDQVLVKKARHEKVPTTQLPSSSSS